MYNPKEQKPDAGDSKAGDVTRPAKDASREPVQITDKDVIKAKDTVKPSFTPSAGPDDPKPPLHAARGNDDVMSQPPQKTS